MVLVVGWCCNFKLPLTAIGNGRMIINATVGTALSMEAIDA